jgi:hypothetical protein
MQAAERLARTGVPIVCAAHAESFLFQVFPEHADQFDVIVN